MFGFCMARITSCVMRIVWACRPHNVRIGIAAQIFVAAGVVLLFVINLLFAQRIVRAAHPNFGWHKAFSTAFKVLYVLVVLFLIMLISAVVDSFYTLNKHTRMIDRRLQLTGATYYVIVSFLPIPMVIIGLLIPRKVRLEKFGSGSWRLKVTILLVSAFLLCLGATFRLGTSFMPPRPRNDPPAYFSKACFYIFDFTVEIIVIYLYIIMRVDRRFHVPNGSHGPGDYLRQAHTTKEQSAPNSGTEREGESVYRVNTEEEVFDDKEPEDDVRPKDLETGNQTA